MSVTDEVRIPESWEFWTGMYDAGVVETGIPLDACVAATGLPFVPTVPQPDPVAWLNDRMKFWTPTP